LPNDDNLPLTFEDALNVLENKINPFFDDPFFDLAYMDSQNTSFNSSNSKLSDFGIGDSWLHWFGRGFLAGLMETAALNAMSYFLLSDGVSNLIGASTEQVEAIGFPFEVWRKGESYGRNMVNFPAFYADCTLGLIFAVVVGTFVARKQTRLNQILLHSIQQEANAQHSEDRSFQFSIKSMMIATSIIALFLGAALNVSADPKVLAAIFFAGPWVMLGLSMLPPKIKWQHRVIMMTVMAISSIFVAILVGGQLGKPFDEVLMGIFICWTPQSFAGIFVLIGYKIFKTNSA